MKATECPRQVFVACQAAQGSRVTAVFGPQHGYRQCEQDNMRETPDERYTFYGSGAEHEGEDVSVPLFSLYSERREPSLEQLEQVDTLVLDLPDIGCRYCVPWTQAMNAGSVMVFTKCRIYTFVLTLAACLRAADRCG
jgi:uncharacterized protein YbbC (DUF1343 family)